MHSRRIVLGVCLLVSSASLGGALSLGQAAFQKPVQEQTVAKVAAADDVHDGEIIFHNNCSRCHNTPEGFPPRISGTIVKHMRVRASLSKEDEVKLLRFLNQ